MLAAIAEAMARQSGLLLKLMDAPDCWLMADFCGLVDRFFWVREG
jgi:hypothetical protein